MAELPSRQLLAVVQARCPHCTAGPQDAKVYERLGREWDAMLRLLAQAAVVPVEGAETGFLRRRVEDAQALLTEGEIPSKWRAA